MILYRLAKDTYLFVDRHNRQLAPSTKQLKHVLTMIDVNISLEDFLIIFDGINTQLEEGKEKIIAFLLVI